MYELKTKLNCSWNARWAYNSNVTLKKLSFK